MITVGMFGCGTVGQGTLKVLQENAALIKRRTGRDICFKTIVVLDPSVVTTQLVQGIKVSANADDILLDPQIQVVVEVMGGEHPAYEYIKKALQQKKHVVTANKEVIAKHKREFFALARRHKVDIFFEASVGGGIPLIRALKVGFAANQVQSLYGILNGTTNYILTRIEEDQVDFSVALKKAQEQGFAEADPAMDVSGLDTAYKLSILAAVAFKIDVRPEDIHYEGIERITLKDIINARELGYAIKLLAIGKNDGQKVALRVQPTMIPRQHPLASVRNEYNALFIEGNAVGAALLSGKGAGALPTGSAVVSDLIDLAFDVENKITPRNLEHVFTTCKLQPSEDTTAQFYLRLLVQDTYGVLETITGILGRNKVSILKIWQKDIIGTDAELLIVTHQVREKFLNKAVAQLQKLAVVKNIYTVIRVGLDEN